MREYRARLTATMLRDGRVLIVGDGLSSVSLDSAELYDPSTGTTVFTGAQESGRSLFTTTLLSNGKVLVAGGDHRTDGIKGFNPPTLELYDPAVKTFAKGPSLLIPRHEHTATLLEDGRVVFLGGLTRLSQETTAIAVVGAFEIYNPGTNSITGGNWFTYPRSGHVSFPLAGGRVLVLGGEGPSVLGPAGWERTYPDTIEVFDPATGVFTPAGRLQIPRRDPSAVMLPDGRILVCAGSRIDTREIAEAEIYDPSTGFSTLVGSLQIPRTEPSVTLLPNGKVWIIGGINLSGDVATPEVFDSRTGTFSLHDRPMYARRHRHAACVTPDGQILIFGGQTNPSYQSLIIERFKE